MTRIFTSLAALNILPLVASFVVGMIPKFGVSDRASDLHLIHITLGLGTALGILLVHCLIFTYFLGTGRWVKEVGLAYDLPDDPLPKLTRELKRKTFPPALAAMLITIATAAAGAGTQMRLPQWPWQVHGALSLLALLANLW